MFQVVVVGEQECPRWKVEEVVVVVVVVEEVRQHEKEVAVAVYWTWVEAELDVTVKEVAEEAAEAGLTQGLEQAELVRKE
jgi:hypothetical protein